MGDALRFAPSFLRTALRLTQSICLYVDGLPRPITTVYDIPVETVDRVEVYGLRALQEGALRQWPAGAPCGNPSGAVNPRSGTGPPVRSPSGGASGRFGLQGGMSSRREPMDDFVRVVVVWLRR